MKSFMVILINERQTSLAATRQWGEVYILATHFPIKNITPEDWKKVNLSEEGDNVSHISLNIWSPTG